MTFAALTLLLLLALPLPLVAGTLCFMLAINGIAANTYPNPDSK